MASTNIQLADIIGRLGLGEIESGKGVNLGANGPSAGLWVDSSMRAMASKFKETKPTWRTERQMIDIKQRLIAEFAIRDMLFRFLARIYDGEYWKIVSSQILDGGFHYQRSKAQSDDKYRLTVNYIFSSVNSYVDMLGKNPSLHVPPLWDADDEAKTIANQNEKLLYGIWEASQMEAQMNDNAWFLSLLGSSAVESTPDITDLIPKLQIQHPGLFYPKMRFGQQGEYLYGIKRMFLDPDQMSDAFGDSWRDSGKYVTTDTSTGQWVQTDEFTRNVAKVEAWLFYSPWERALFVQDRVLNDYSIQFDEPHEIPWRIIPFFSRPGKTYGVGAAEQAWGLNQYINYLTSMEANIVAYSAIPLLHVRNGQHVDEQIPNDPGGVINTGENGAVEWVSPAHPAQDMTNALTRSKKMLQDVTGIPEEQYGNTRQSFATGRAVEQLNAPLAERVRSRQRVMSAEFQHINRIALRQFEQIAKNRTVELYGQSQEQGAFTLKMKGADVQGYYRNIVTWDDHDHADTVEILQLEGAGMLDRRTGLTKLGYREPDQILERVRKDRLEDITFMRLAEEAKMVPVPAQDVSGLAPGKLTNDIMASAQAPAGPMQQQAGLENGGIPGGPGGMMPGLTSPIGAAPSEGGAGSPPGPSGSSPVAAGGASPISGPAAAVTAPGVNMPHPVPSPVRKGFGPGSNLHLANGGIFHLGTVVSDFKAVPAAKIKGRVFLYGHIVDGAASKIQVFLTAGIDKATLINALPDYKGSLLFQVGKTPPAGAIDVTPQQGNLSGSGAPSGPTGGIPPVPSDNSPWGPGSKMNPQGLQGPLRQDHLVTPVYQQVPLPPPGVGPLDTSPTGR